MKELKLKFKIEIEVNYCGLETKEQEFSITF